MTDKYAVIGNPIAHSKSPQIHKMFAEETGQDISYEAILAPLDGFAVTVERLRKEGYKGCNVTVPFKFEAFKIACNYTLEVMDAAESDQEGDAINTLLFKDNKIGGYNTDGTGLINDIEKNLKTSLKGKRILLIGAGGAAAGILHPLMEASQSPLAIYNRTLKKAEGLIKRVTQNEKFQLSSIKPLVFGELSKEHFDIVINATSAGLKDEMPDIPKSIFAPGALAYDLMYGRETQFMKFAREHGVAKVSDGLGMLVEQAAESFYIWRGVRPSTTPVIAALRQS